MKKEIYRTEYAGENKDERISYFLLSDSEGYGIGIQMKNLDEADMCAGSYAANITTDKNEAERLIKCFADEGVQPVHLYELMENYLGQL